MRFFAHSAKEIDVDILFVGVSPHQTYDRPTPTSGLIPTYDYTVRPSYCVCHSEWSQESL